MICPDCNSPDTHVKGCRKFLDLVARERVCKNCGKIFYTKEIALDDENGKKWYRWMESNYVRKRKIRTENDRG